MRDDERHKLDLTEADLLKAAQDFDSGVNQGVGGDAGQATEPAKPTENGPQDAAQPDDGSGEAGSKAGSEKDGGEGGEKQPKPDEKAKEDSQEQKKSKFARENERREKTWREINAEKEAMKAEREAIKRERDEWEAQRKSQQSVDPENMPDGKGFTARQYEEEAARLKEAGEDKLADVARDLARKAREAGQKARVESEQAKFNKAFQDNYNRLSEKNDWLKDQNHDKYKRTVDLLSRYPVLQQTPDGLNHAVELIELQDKANASDKLQSQIDSLTKELETLRKKTSIGPGKPTSQPAETPFEKLSLKEQEAQLERLAREFDASR